MTQALTYNIGCSPVGQTQIDGGHGLTTSAPAHIHEEIQTKSASLFTADQMSFYDAASVALGV